MPFFDYDDKYTEVNVYSEFVAQVQNGHKYLMCSDGINAQNLSRLLTEVRAFKLQGLDLSGNELRSPCVELLSEELKENQHLEELGLHYTELDNDCLEALASSIKANTSLLAIDISCNNFTNISSLAEAIKGNKSLQHLELGYNKFQDPADAIVRLVLGLEANQSLKELSIVSVDMKDSGAIVLAGMIAANCTLVRLDVSYNKIEDKGGIAIAHSLKTNQTLRELKLMGNKFSDDVAHAFACVLGVGGNRSLRILGLDENDIQEEGFSALEEALKVNSVIEGLWVPYFNTDHPAHAVCNRILILIDGRRRERNQARLDAFEKAQTGDTTTPWLRSKLMVVGRGAAGKTNTVRSLLGFNFNSEWDSTVGIDLTEVATAFGSRWKKTKHKDFASEFVHRLAVEALDVSKSVEVETPQTEAKVTVQELVHREPEAPLTETNESVVQEKVSPSNRERKEPMVQYKEELFMNQEDAKDSIRMSIWDYGGQTVFYTLHHLFLTQYGIYLIVFNMSKLLKSPQDTSEYLLFWLNSIKLHAPNAPVLLVGTFLDQLDIKTEGSSQLQKISTILNKLSVGFEQVCSFEDSVFCPTSNKDKSGIQNLRSAIEQETQDADFVRTPVSLKWMRALDILANSEDAWMQVAALKAEVESIGIERDDEVDRMLRLFHELGVVLYFSSSVRLKEVVIWKPEWLLEKLSMVIRDKDIHGYDEEKLEEIQLTKDAEYFFTDGIISRDLLEFVWDQAQVDYLVELMRHLLLLSDWGFSDNELYLVPSMLSSKTVKSTSGIQFYLVFAFLPQGVFERICCLCVGYSSSVTPRTSPQLCKDKCIVDLGGKGLLQVEVTAHNKVSVMLSETTEAGWVLDFFLSMMRRIQDDFMHGGLVWKVWVQKGAEFILHEDAKKQKLKPWIRMKQETNKAAIEKFLDL